MCPKELREKGEVESVVPDEAFSVEDEEGSPEETEEENVVENSGDIIPGLHTIIDSINGLQKNISYYSFKVELKYTIFILIYDSSCTHEGIFFLP